ncbi:MAG: neutral/alkaline non-lysosomal ceramidase N-terminal domain-containing protein, partial [Aureliella sp.]
MKLTCLERWAQISALWVLVIATSGSAQAAEKYLVGFGKAEVTPQEPVRLSGYATREKPHEGVADPLFARAMVLTEQTPPAQDKKEGDAQQADAAAEPQALVLVSIDSIAVVADMTKRVTERVLAEYGIPRSDIVICATHSHAAPHVASGLTNLYRTPLSDQEKAALERNTARIEQGILKAVADAMKSRRGANLEVGETQASFAVNRRVLENGIWSGFGVQADGPVDRRVRLLRAVTSDGQLLGAAFMYACHCTTLGPDFNRVSGDWAGLSASELERKHAGAVFVPVIGCGADANPEPRTGYPDALEHGAEMAAKIEAALKGQWKQLNASPVAHFGYAGLAPERPTKAELEAAKSDPNVHRRRWAESMLATWQKMGRLPETYPDPIHTWQFGKELVWVFLGGEVVVDYQMRLEQELPADQVWVAAYTDDVFAYVASERMRAEGGYEVDFSMIYYNQPGRWQSGTEDLISRRVAEILKEEAPADKPRDPQAALRSIRVPEGFQVDLVAAEPLVDDPINIAFGHDGRVWVVEMADYPLGAPGGGRVRWLRDRDGDGKLDESHVLLSGLDFPTSVAPWRDGIIVIAAPSIFFAADRDGDGKPEIREDLLTGIGAANPQHRASGFEMGLDGWLHFTAGDDTHQLLSTRTGKTHDVTRRDVCWNPDTGELYTTSGMTQFVRARDEFGNWFGNVNNQPIFHYVIEDKYRRKGGYSGPAQQPLLDPPVAPPVYPYSHTKDRFNDLNTFNRFTSACSSIIVRVPGLGDEMRGAALVCEPVHNLVARFRVSPEGASFRGERFANDSKYDWFASSDPFSRPVRVVNAPDGTVWIVDMVREVIEHPEWIPIAWQERLNLRSGSGLGRIYRVRRQDFQPQPIPKTTELTATELVKLIGTDNAAACDLVAQEFIWRATSADATLTPAEKSWIVTALQGHMRESPVADMRARARWILVGMGAVDSDGAFALMCDPDPRVRRYGVALAERWLNPSEGWAWALLALPEEEPQVLFQQALSVGARPSEEFSPVIEAIARQATKDAWLAKALSLVHQQHVAAALRGCLTAMEHPAESNAVQAALEATIGSLWRRADQESRSAIVKQYFSVEDEQVALNDTQLILLAAAATTGLEQLTDDSKIQDRLRKVVAATRERLFTGELDAQQRARLVPLLALNKEHAAQALNDVARLLGPKEPSEVQQAALALARNLRSDEMPQAILAHWSQLLPDVRSSVCSLLLERRPWAEQLIGALESGRVKVSDLDAALVQRLRTYGDADLKERTQRVLGQTPNSD